MINLRINAVLQAFKTLGIGVLILMKKKKLLILLLSGIVGKTMKN
jgi:hypothetical protein